MKKSYFNEKTILNTLMANSTKPSETYDYYFRENSSVQKKRKQTHSLITNLGANLTHEHA